MKLKKIIREYKASKIAPVCIKGITCTAEQVAMFELRVGKTMLWRGYATRGSYELKQIFQMGFWVEEDFKIIAFKKTFKNRVDAGICYETKDGALITDGPYNHVDIFPKASMLI